MNAAVKGGAWLNWAAMATWLVVDLPAAFAVASGNLAGAAAAVWLAAFLLFGGALALCLWERAWRPGASGLLVQTLCGIVIVGVTRSGTPSALLVIVAAQLPYFVSPRLSWGWIAAQTVILAGVFLRIDDGSLNALAAALAFGGFQMFATATSSLAISERAARKALTEANVELTATRELLAENTRAAERLRISRDLHDTLGHHLTALSLQLDVASRLASGAAAEHVVEAHAITRLLLSDVRGVVSELRDSREFDLAEAVRKLAMSAGPLQVHVDVPPAFETDAPARGEALLRGIQEIITNAVRHAGARNLWIRVARTNEGITLDARDDGCGSAALTWGNGLSGMRERFEEHAGSVEVTSRAGGGFEVHGFLPRSEPA